jgi:hypothetical protein
MNSPETFQAGFSVLGIIIVVVVWALSALFKRKEDDQTELPPELKGPRSRKPAQPPVARSWEEELRRVLGQPAAAPPPLVREVPPPVQQVHRPRVSAPPPPIEPHIQVTLPPPRPRIEPMFQQLAGLTEATQRYEQAMTLEQRVTKHMGDVTSHRVGTTTVVRREIAPEVFQAISAVRTGQGARAAVLASIILGPPRALEPHA